MKRWSGGIFVMSLFVLLILMYSLTRDPLGNYPVLSVVQLNATDQLHWQHAEVPTYLQSPENGSDIISVQSLISSLFNLSSFVHERELLETWNHLTQIGYINVLPHAMEAIVEAGNAWKGLVDALQAENRLHNSSILQMSTEKQCPYSVHEMNASQFGSKEYRQAIPCGLIEGSSITIICIPGGPVGNFRIDLTGKPIPGDLDLPIILHYNVRLHGDKITENPVIVQNTWTLSQDWGAEERCPSPQSKGKVDDLDKCSSIVGKNDSHHYSSSKHSTAERSFTVTNDGTKFPPYFPFRQGYLSVATLNVGAEGFHMSVDGKHITSFAYRERLEPWLVSELRISGNLNMFSVLASGLPSSEDLGHAMDLETLKSPLLHDKQLDLFIGIFSTANNFNRRMAVRRTWMQYAAVRSGTAAVRFFVGLHKNELVNEELWKEARTYKDIQLMPFVDYYHLITLKTIAICIYGTQVVSAKYVMKTDDDAFVRVDEIIVSLKKMNLTAGLLYGLIESESRPHRDHNSKWYISNEEWPEDSYPPWAHGPGYVVSNDIAETIIKWYKKGRLKMFKLEDVAMGLWIAEMKKGGLDVRYVNEGRIYNVGCEDGYIVAHYQEPKNMLCLWQKMQDSLNAKCCGDGKR